ncbi:hypothetical protein SA2016_0218 [Sinomonas atrocyanea]|uniref:Uncharacterized protein n=1 Tax=Sinomonas atrocyanea TaxID=37927 RepID=A0A126ZUT8_9MICC|nr:hypothetical protein [Sinomonas atrocyanea]AMM30919.1 hypothetical protein SA2016_0218 [Sinomonas atrocyanea]GEB63159.1 hypothetical protein SAT01_06070 [Sinomonas atrocyanea]GGG65369.1 hypothetical protein GCM10007172_16050 [Sinomonas atrocyanea]
MRHNPSGAPQRETLTIAALHCPACDTLADHAIAPVGGSARAFGAALRHRPFTLFCLACGRIEELTREQARAARSYAAGRSA